MNTHDFKSENKIVHEYTITVDQIDEGEEIRLCRSYNECWSEDRRGEQIIKLIDTGDGLIYPKKMFSRDVDYAMHAELFILLAFLNKTEHMPLYEGVIEEINPRTSFQI